MQLTVLGAGTCLPYSGYSAPGYLLQSGKLNFLLDAGPGVLSRMASHSFDFRKLDYVLITHLHPDHTLDLLALIQALGATPDRDRPKGLNLIGCSGLNDFLENLLGIYRDIMPDNFSMNVTEASSEAMQFPGWLLRAAHTGHTDSSLAFRIETNHTSMVYTGDVANPDGLVDLCTNADLLVCECSFPEGHPSDDHLNAVQVGRLAHASSVRRLLLTHLYPAAIEHDLVNQVRKYFPGRVEKAIDGLVISL